MIVACRFRRGWVLARAIVSFVVARENCFYKISAYVWPVSIYTGLSSQCGNSDTGRSIPGGMDLRISGCKFLSIHLQASGKLDVVVIRRHLLQAADSICKNYHWQVRCSWRETGSFLDWWAGSTMANHAAYFMFTGMVATLFRKKIFSFKTCS